MHLEFSVRGSCLDEDGERSGDDKAEVISGHRSSSSWKQAAAGWMCSLRVMITELPRTTEAAEDSAKMSHLLFPFPWVLPLGYSGIWRSAIEYNQEVCKKGEA